MSEKEKKNMEESSAEDAVETDEGKNEREQHNNEGAGSSKDDQKATKTEMDFKMTKPW